MQYKYVRKLEIIKKILQNKAEADEDNEVGFAFSTCKMYQVGRIEPPSGPVLAPGLYVWPYV